MTDDERWQTAVIREIRELAPRIKSFTLDLPRPIRFIAGQHADVRLTTEDGYEAIRSYSIASTPEGASRIELAIERLDNGEVSPFFHDVVLVSDEIEVRAPLGRHFIWRPADGGPLLLVGAGSGIVPLVAMLRHQHRTGPDLPVVLLASARRWEDLPFRDELLALHRERKGFALQLALTRDETSFSDVAVTHHRLDADVVEAALSRLPAPPSRVFVCGSTGFVDTAADAAVQAGVPAGSVRTERYGA